MKELTLLTVFLILAFSSYEFKPQDSATNKIFESPPKQITSYIFGYNDMLASALWVRALQDIEVCDQNLKGESWPELKKDEDALKQILNRQMPRARCENSWVYKMLDVITDLMPDFYFAYIVGGTFLSVLVDDRLGAQKIYKKGRSYFPEEWELIYRLAYHELFEMQNAESAAVLLKRAGERGAPPWVYALSAKIYSQLGQAQFAKTIIESVLARDPNGPVVERLRERLRLINETLRKNQ